MFDNFKLIITPRQTCANLCLLNASGEVLGQHLAKLDQLTLSERHALFDLHTYLHTYVAPEEQLAAIAEIGVCIAMQVMGEQIFDCLWQDDGKHSVQICLPPPHATPQSSQANEELAQLAAFARLPWELARKNRLSLSLAQRNFRFCIEHQDHPQKTRAMSQSLPLVPLQAGDALRVLFIFAQAQDSSPLAMRQERHAILSLFQQQIATKFALTLHTLAHDLSRASLVASLRSQGGFHLVHWSGHGQPNGLEINASEGQTHSLSGTDLLEIFKDAGVALPHIMVLSACHSGNVQTARWWQSGARLKHERGIPAAPQKEIELPAAHSLSGVAHALLQAGVPNILAMRFAVGDDYARELALAMYQQYFLGAEQLNLAAALCVARQTLRAPSWQDKFSVCDHATAVLFSQTQSNLPLSSVNAGAVANTNASTKGGKNRLRPSTVFDANNYFVGRAQALAALAAACSQSSTAGGRRKNNASVLQIIGLGGMGKTTLAAEALDLWQSQFDWVVEFHGKTDHLSVEFVLAEIHWRLQNQLGVYHAHVQAFSADAIYRPATPQFQGRSRLQRLMQNLLRALRDEAFLLIFDNLESVLEDDPTRTQPVQQTEQPVWHCRDTQFDSLLQTIAKGLLGSPSRLLVTTRKPLAALQRYCQHIVLGPLPLAEAKIFLRQFPVLMSVSNAAPEHLDSAENAHIIAQILAASRGHPLLLDRLARMANMPDQQHALAQLLQQLQRPLGERNFAGLPESLSALHIAQGEQVRQLRYLENALIESLDQLIAQQTQATCYLLWLIALANDAIADTVVQQVWQRTQAADQLAFTAQFLQDLGFITFDAKQRTYACHELVGERVLAWAQQNTNWKSHEIWLQYALCLRQQCIETQFQAMEAAMHAGGSAVMYFVQAEDYQGVADLAGHVVTSGGDIAALHRLLPSLEKAARLAQRLDVRSACVCHVADAKRKLGHIGASLALYRQAAQLARRAQRAAGHEVDLNERLAWIYGNWSNALLHSGDILAARMRMRASAKAAKRAQLSALDIIGRQLEALRIDIMLGEVEQAAPQIAPLLARVSRWWQAWRCNVELGLGALPSGLDNTSETNKFVEDVEDNIDIEAEYETLSRVYISALDIAKEAALAQDEWQAALHYLDAMKVAETSLNSGPKRLMETEFGRASVLVHLERYDEAQLGLEACIPHCHQDRMMLAKIYSALANLFDEQGDIEQALRQERRALAIAQSLDEPEERAFSHANLAVYLHRSSTKEAAQEEQQHRLAALLYLLCAGLQHDLQLTAENYIACFAEAEQEGKTITIPHLAQLLADPAFSVLASWLAAWIQQQKTTLSALQADVDQLMATFMRLALEE